MVPIFGCWICGKKSRNATGWERCTTPAGCVTLISCLGNFATKENGPQRRSRAKEVVSVHLLNSLILIHSLGEAPWKSAERGHRTCPLLTQSGHWLTAQRPISGPYNVLV